MPVPSWLSSDAVEPKIPPRTRPGWAPRPNQKIKLVGAWAYPETGSGQEQGIGAGDDWWADPSMNPVVAPLDQQAAATPDSLTVPGSDATVSPGPGTSTLAPRTPAARSVLPSSAAPAARTGITSGPPGPPPQGSPSAARLAPSQSDFVRQVTPLALTESQRSGIPAQVYLGIAINETGWGGSTLARDQHNYFSIKGQGLAGSASYNAWEVVNGQNTTQNSAFRAYKDPQQSFSDFTDFLHENPRYQPALDYIRVHPNDWRGFVHMLNDEGYATDPAWADKVISLGSQFSDDASYPASSVTHSVDQQGGVGSVLSVGSQAIGQRYQL